MQETILLLYRDNADSFHLEELEVDSEGASLVCNNIVYFAPSVLLNSQIGGYIRLQSVYKPVNPD